MENLFNNIVIRYTNIMKENLDDDLDDEDEFQDYFRLRDSMKIIDEIFNMTTMVDIELKFSEIFKRFINQMNKKIQNSI